jgi:hypothetical protein
MNLNDVVTFIITDASVGNTAGMNSIITAIRERQKLNRANATAVAKVTFQKGTKVKIKDITPKYWVGMTAEIVGFNSKKTVAKLRITDNCGVFRVAVGQERDGFPLSCLAAITPVAPEYDTTVLDFLDA